MQAIARSAEDLNNTSTIGYKKIFSKLSGMTKKVQMISEIFE